MERFSHSRLEQLSGREILAAVFCVVVGREFTGSISDQEKFFQDLRRFQKHQTRLGKPTITLPAIRSWFRSGEPKRSQAFAFLHDFVRDWRTRVEDEVPADRSTAYDRLAKFLDQSSGRDTLSLDPATMDPTAAIAVNTMLNLTARNQHSEFRSFFRGGDNSDEGDLSYYLVFRYSTHRGVILKSFLVIHKPSKANAGLFSFTHFMWPSQRPEAHRYAFRESTGVILKLERSFYFLGYDYTVPVDKKKYPRKYAVERSRSKLRPNAVDTIALEYDDVDRSDGIYGGVTLTVAAGHQPVIARVAFLHIGTRSALGRDVSDDLVVPAEVAPGDLHDDLRNTFRRLREAGCDRFGEYVEDLLRRFSLKDGFGEEIAGTVTHVIDNTPDWERKQRRGKIRSVQARGAIEAFGVNRPRE